MTSTTIAEAKRTVIVAYQELVEFAGRVFAVLGLPADRARAAAEALCHGDLTGMTSHGLTNLSRLYVPLLTEGRADALAEPAALRDLGPAVLWDARRSLGLWAAAQAMDLAADRAGEYGVGLVSVRGATHFGCAGYHTGRVARRGVIGVIAANCGRQRIARAPGGRPALLGTNPLSIAAPAGDRHPFVLDMSTTVVPTGRIRQAHRAGRPIPPGWLEDDEGRPVTDPAALDEGTGFLRWLGGDVATGAYKGFGLGLLVEVLAALVPGAGLGPEPEALSGSGTPTGRDDDIGFLALAIDPGALRDRQEFLRSADTLFGTLLASPPRRSGEAVRYPGWHEGEQAARRLAEGVPISVALHRELRDLAATHQVPALRAAGGTS
jgi:LDH2 family malate/lactate/ureidoglycolate dehydrogenase